LEDIKDIVDQALGKSI